MVTSCSLLPAATAALTAALALPSLALAAPPRPLHRSARVQRARPLRRPKVPPLVTREIMVLTLGRTAKGLQVLANKRGKLKRRGVVPRFRGPFEVRLYAKAKLRDVLTFSFPLTLPAGEPTRLNRGLHKALLAGVEARTQVRVPWVPGLTHLLLVDKQRRKTTRYSLGKKRALKDGHRALPGPKRTDSLGTRRLFGTPSKNKTKGRSGKGR